MVPCGGGTEIFRRRIGGDNRNISRLDEGMRAKDVRRLGALAWCLLSRGPGARCSWRPPMWYICCYLHVVLGEFRRSPLLRFCFPTRSAPLLLSLWTQYIPPHITHLTSPLGELTYTSPQLTSTRIPNQPSTHPPPGSQPGKPPLQTTAATPWLAILTITTTTTNTLCQLPPKRTPNSDSKRQDQPPNPDTELQAIMPGTPICPCTSCFASRPQHVPPGQQLTEQQREERLRDRSSPWRWSSKSSNKRKKNDDDGKNEKDSRPVSTASTLVGVWGVGGGEKGKEGKGEEEEEE